MRLKVRFVVRGLLLALPVAVIASAVLTLVMNQAQVGWPPDLTPLPPTILAPRGELPTGPVGLQELARYRGEACSLVGSGFLILLSDGTIVGVTTGHSVSLAIRTIRSNKSRWAGLVKRISWLSSIRCEVSPANPGRVEI